MSESRERDTPQAEPYEAPCVEDVEPCAGTTEAASMIVPISPVP